MSENQLSAIKDWCETHLSEDTIKKLDNEEISPIDLYRDFTKKGWLKCADVFADPKNLHKLMQVLKTLSRYSSDICNMAAVTSVCSIMLNTFGSDPQKEIAQKGFRGEALFSFSLTEPEAGSDIENLKTEAKLVNGKWVLNGTKFFATGAAIADYILIVARTSPEKPLNHGISVFLVPREIEGITITPQEKIATNGFSSCEISLESVTLPENAIIGGKDTAWGAIAFAGGMERLMVAVSCVGLSQNILKFLYEFTQTRMIQGKPLFDIQLINHQLADMAIKIKAADLMVENAVRLLSEGKTPAFEICGAKVFASEMQQEISMQAMKIVGGRAYLKEYPVERWMREGLLPLYAGGTNELQKNLIVRKLHSALDFDAA